MKKSITLLAEILWMGAICLSAQAEGTPRIQFDRMLYDFGKTSQVAIVSGIFQVKNVGDGLLKIAPPKPSCGCTLVELKPDTLPPGTTGELSFTLHLGQIKAQFDKKIVVPSNDPLSPEVSLTIKADYTPLYDVSPMTLALKLEFGSNATAALTTIARTDGKPLRLGKLITSKPCLTATVEPGVKADEATARIRVTLRREGPPRRFNEYVHIYAADETNKPVSSIYVYGQIMGEVLVSPEALYWSVSPATNSPTDRPEALLLRRVTIRPADGKAIKLKNPHSTIKGLTVEVVTKKAGQLYELVARLDEVPASTVSGMVSFETSVPTQSRVEVPVIVHVSKP